MDEGKQKLVKVFIAMTVSSLLIFLAFYYVISNMTSNDEKKFNDQVVSESVVNHLIAGVPCYTLYNTLLSSGSFVSSQAATVKEVFDFWGYDGEYDDTGISFRNIEEKFSADKLTLLHYVMKSNGFEAQLFIPKKTDAANSREELDFIKSYISRDIPVIIAEQRIESMEPRAYRLVIGIYDESRKIVMHDYAFGNNYEISYDDFERMFVENDGGLALAIWPSAGMEKDLKPIRLAEYPERDEDIMNRVGKMWSIWQNQIENNGSDLQASINALNDMIKQEDFDLLPPSYKILLYNELAIDYLDSNNPKESIKIINEKSLPLNHDLDADFGVFTNKDASNYYKDGKSSRAYLLLGRAYYVSGEKKLAEKAFQESIALKPDYLSTLSNTPAEIRNGIMESMKAVGIL